MMFVLFFCFLLLIQFLLSKIGKQKKKKKGSGDRIRMFQGFFDLFSFPPFSHFRIKVSPIYYSFFLRV